MSDENDVWEISSSSESERETTRKRKRRKADSDSDEYIPYASVKGKSPTKSKTTAPRKRISKKNVSNTGGAETAVNNQLVSLEDSLDEPSISGDSSKVVKKPAKRKKVDSSDSGTPKTKKPRIVKPKTTKPRKTPASKSKIEDVGDDGISTSNTLPGACMDWDDAELLSQMQDVDVWVARNVKNLFDQDNTIPFIARYRKELTNDMGPEKLRYMKESYDLIKVIKQKAASVINSINKLGKLTPDLEKCLRCARSLNEIDFIYTPFKPGSKRTLAERARQLGLEEPAMLLLEGKEYVYTERLVQPDKDGLRTVNDVELGIQHIIADVMSKNKELLDTLRTLKETADIRLSTDRAKSIKSTKEKANAANKMKPEGTVKDEKKHSDKKNEDDETKFQLYFNFSERVKSLRPHQVLAINRGEHLKILSVKFTVTEWLLKRLTDFCFNFWYNKGLRYPLRLKIFQESIKDAYNRLLQPLLIRQIRSELNQTAERAAIEVFATNLKHLLLSPPVKGKNILGIDPGFRNGCKLGLISPTGEILETDVIYPNLNSEPDPENDLSAKKLRLMLLKHSCELIALGNGTACREMESYLSFHIKRGWFRPLDVQFTIISEQGASIYSCSPLAQKEFPKLDPNMISAVSLARRAQDPLAELVKVEPKHLGVGMYQHDVPEKQLSTTLDEVVVECVSFVGVDINTASDVLLKRVAGLNVARAQKLIQWRSTNGPFRNRQQIMNVKGIGEKTFQQCAGFIRIIPETYQKSEMNKSESSLKRKQSANDTENPLDRTWIHPESYAVAGRFITKCEVDLVDLGKPNFIQKVQSTLYRHGLEQLASELGIPVPLMKLISDGLQQLPGHDLRTENQTPLFRRSITSLADLKVGMVVTGRVQNVTHFGAFVDVGVGRDGLIHCSKFRGRSVQLGQRVEVKITSVEHDRKRIQLDLVKIL